VTGYARPYRVTAWTSHGAASRTWLTDVGTYKTLPRAREAARVYLTSLAGDWVDRHGVTALIEDRDNPGHKERRGWPEDASREDLMTADPVLLGTPLPEHPTRPERASSTPATPAPEPVKAPPCALTWAQMDYERITRHMDPREADALANRLDAPCPACGHVVICHPGDGNPALTTCLLCDLAGHLPSVSPGTP
jgi:hypothetical protein